MNGKIKILSLLVFIWAANIMAQENPPDIITDRPDITESGVVVLPGVFQFEDGFILENQNTNGDGIRGNIRNYTYSSLLTRIGIINRFELRIGGDYLYEKVNVNNVQDNISGFNNVLIGAKYQIMSEELNGQDFGLILQFYLPVGNEAFRPKNVEPELLVAAGKDLTELFSVSANIGTHWNSVDNIPVFLYSTSFGFSISERWDSFVEIYGEDSRNSSISGNFDFGLAYRPLNNFQIDVSAGNESLSDFNSWFIGGGLSVRFPK